MFNKFIRRPVLSIVISLIIVFLGVIAIAKLPVTQFPSISPPKVNVIAEYPGANGELMTKAVLIPLERAINGIPGMKYMASDAGNDGEASIQVVFNLGTDPNIAAVNVQNRVASVVNKLPPLVVREGVKITREESNMLMYINLYSNDPNMDQKFLFNFADINILSELKRVNGVGFADILGNREYAMRIWLRPDRMLAYNISADEVMKALDEQSLEASPGKTGESSGKRSQAFEYVIKYPGRASREKRHRPVPSCRATVAGSPPGSHPSRESPQPGVTLLQRRSTCVALAVLASASAALAGSTSARALAQRTLRVCADPNNLPFSNRRLEGFENRLAALVARELGERVEYTWWPQRRGFLRRTLEAGRCDVVMGVPSNMPGTLTTRPYYRSTYVFVTRAGSRAEPRSFDDPVLRTLRIGVHFTGGENPPPATALARRGLARNIASYSIYGDYRQAAPPARLIEAVARGAVDVAVAWGPLAGYFARREHPPLRLTAAPAFDTRTGEPMTFAIAMAVRPGDRARRDALDRILTRRAREIQALLTSYGVPLVEEPVAESR